MSTVQILYDGTDISDDVIYADATFEMQMNAVVGTCSFRVRDPGQTYSFTTGREIRLLIDGIPMWGGYLRRKDMTYSFPADDTSSPTTYPNRVWHLQGADYNILLDNRVIRRSDNYTTHVPNADGYAKSTMDGWALWKLLRTFSDFPSGFDITADRADATNIDDITTVLPDTATTSFWYKQQGSKLREQFDDLAKMAGAAFYIGPEKSVHYHAWEDVEKRWGFSDNPNETALTVSPASYQNSDWKFHEVTGEEDGTLITNDALIWGGSAIGSQGDVIFARYQDEVDDLTTSTYTYIQHGNVVADSSIDKHGRWQLGEVHTEGGGYGNIKGVKARANTIINGPPGASGSGLQKGLRYPQWTFSFSWWAHDVPLLSGTPDHIRAGDIVSIKLAVFGVSQFAPCRTIRITFPELKPDGTPVVLMNGDFSLSYTDPIALWKGVLGAAKAQTTTTATVVPMVYDNTATTTVYGGEGVFTPAETPNGSTTLFTLPVGYISNSLIVYINGLIQRPGTDYTETSGTAGTFTLTTAPVSTDSITVTCRTLAT